MSAAAVLKPEEGSDEGRNQQGFASRLSATSAEAEPNWLRKEQARIAVEFHNPNLTGWYYTDGAYLGICDLLLEECLILQEIKRNAPQ